MVAAVTPPSPPVTVPPAPPSTSPSPQRPVALRFSNVFIPGPPKRQSELDFVDVLVDTDIPLYVDPFAFKIGNSDWAVECNNLVVGFFQELINSMRANRTFWAKTLLNNLHEPNETRLGLSRGTPQGRGVGGLQARALYNAFANSKAVKTGLLADLSDCELFIDGISHDKISDITINVIRRKLVEFTQQQCEAWSIPMEWKPTGPYWDNDAKEWRSGYDRVPVYKGYPMLLVPKRSVRYKMAIDDRDFYNFHVVEFIRQEFERQENIDSNASLIRVLQGGRRRVTKKRVKEDFPFSKAFLMEFAEDHPDVLKEYKEEAEVKIKEQGAPTDSGIQEKVKDIAHSQGKIVIEEAYFVTNNTTNVHGPNYGVAGQNNRVFIGSISIYKSEVDAAPHIDAETKALLKQAIDAIEAAEVKEPDKADAKENLHKLTEELNKPTKEPGLIGRYLTRLVEVVPQVATILTASQTIAGVVGSIRIPGVTG